MAFIGVVAAVGTAAFFINKARGEGEEFPCAPFPSQISIDEVIPMRQKDSDFFWIFDAKYRNRTCIPVTFDIIMHIEIFDEGFGDFVSHNIQNHPMSLNPGEVKGWGWNFIQLVGRKYRITFFVWETLNSGVSIGNKKVITIS